jgi:hypothetical protein
MKAQLSFSHANQKSGIIMLMWAYQPPSLLMRHEFGLGMQIERRFRTHPALGRIQDVAGYHPRYDAVAVWKFKLSANVFKRA